MFMRRRPLLRAAAIGGGAYVVGKRAGQRQADQQEAQSGQSGQSSQSGAGQQDGSQQDGSQYGQYGGTSGQGGRGQSEQGHATPSAAAASIPDQLNRLSALHDQGALTDAEFASAKAKLLGT
jgi:Short C-terminal domain